MLYYHYGGAATTHKIPCACDHINYTLWYITQHQTDYKYIMDGNPGIGKPGEIIIVPPGHRLIHSETDYMTVGFIDDYLYFSADEDMYKLMEELQLPLNRAFNPCDSTLVDSYVRQIQQESKNRKIGFEHKISSLMRDMLVKMCRQHEKAENRASPQKLLVEKVRSEMLSNYNKAWTLATLAAASGYTPSYFCTLYQKMYGITPIDELLQYRIIIAKEELIKRELSVTEISRKCGFSSIHHFSRYFKKYVGVSPAVFSQKN